MKGVTVLKDPILGETIHKRVFASGLTAYVVRKPEFTKSYATIATRYGSIDTSLQANGKTRRLPDGIAHFLEHKIFETPEGDAFDLFAARGASANAFTSFSSTRYLFGTSTDFAGNLRTLLDLVFELHVTDENVEKEKGIIGQEIAMYDDDPDWRIYFGALQGLYARHPVRLDIAGTQETIAAIDPELLRAVHRAYYHPRIMVLAAVSPEPVSTTLRAVAEKVESRSFGPAPGRRPAAPQEARRVRRPTVRVALPVARPRLLLACKDETPGRGGKALLRRELASGVALDALFGNSGSLFLKLYERGLVDESFSASYSADRSYAFAMVGGDTDDAAKLRRVLQRELNAAAARGLSRDDFERVRNKALGGYARAFNAPERIAHLLVGHHLRGTTVTDYRDLLFKLTRAEVNRQLRALLHGPTRCYSVVEPR
ncbi:MAG: EF-P 5-aminopentanol modification-associated protein YfmH [Planctomycetota bacterium]|jgi:predicted Zn-dependent peptidase